MLILALVLIWVAQTVETQPKTVGFVLELSGGWVLDGARVQRGQALAAGARVRVSAAAQCHELAQCSITIILLNNELVSRSCNTTESCSDPIVLPNSLSATSSLLERISQVAARLLSGQQGRYVSTLSRGGVNDLSDGVIELTEDKVILKPLFKHVRTGSYRLDFRQVKADGELSEAPPISRVVNLERHRVSPLDALADGFLPGLYSVSLLEGESGELTGVPAWVLIVSSEQYGRASASFQDAVALTARWRKEVPEQTVRFFLRAFLQYLAEKETR